MGTVEIWEDVSGVGGSSRTDGSGNRIYTRVKMTQVNRTPRSKGGLVFYSDSTAEFVIEDASYPEF